MTMDWFRMFHNLPNDRKIRRFSVAQRWAWVCLHCAASESKERGTILMGNEDQEDLADYCGFEALQDFQFFLDKLRQKGMIDPVENGFRISDWDEKQYTKPSDKPEATRERKRRQRERSKESEQGMSRVTSAGQRVMSRHTDTDPDPDPDPDPDSDPDQEKTPKPPKGAVPQTGSGKISANDLVSAYNQHRPRLWSECKTLNADRRKKLNRFIRDCENPLGSMISAMRYVSKDEWWSVKKLGIDTCLTKNHLLEWSEKAAPSPESSSGPPPEALERERLIGEAHGRLIEAWKEERNAQR